MSLTSVSDVFTGATVENGNLTIPSGTITSWDPTSATVPGGYELVYGLLETLAAKVGTSYSNMSASATSQTIGSPSTAGSKLRRKYTFTVDLDFSGAILDQINVVPPAAPTP